MTHNPNIKQTKEGHWVLVHDTHISRWVEQHGRLDCDGQTLPRILEIIKPGDTVIDVGAFIGDHTAAYLRRVGEKGRVLAFEPNPDAFECLKRNCPEAEAYNVALGEKDNFRLGLLHCDLNAGASSLCGESYGHPVEISSIDKNLCDWGKWFIDSVNLIKIDVEGYEMKVLRGAKNTIEKFHPHLVIEINHGALQRAGTSAQEIYDFLIAFGYKFRPIDPAMAYKDPQLDILAWHSSHSSN
jgi:FkbM family methyltransferase